MKQLIYFYGTFCNPCKSFRPTIDAISQYHPVKFIDVDQDPQTVAEYGIRSVPTVVVLENGRAIDKKSGVLTEGQLRSILS
jgi:thioredoxin 1